MRERVELSGGPRVGSQLVSRDARCTKLGHARRSRVGVHSVAVFAGAMSSSVVDESAAVAWLGGERGSPKRGLPPKLQELLLAGFKSGHWTEDEMYDGTSGDAKQAREVWMAIAADVAAEQKKPLLSANLVRLGQWLDALFIHAKDETSYVPSAAEKKDLDAQDMGEGIELRRLELGMHVGRAPNTAGTDGGVYRGVPNSMAESKLAFKQNHETLDKVVARCRQEGALTLLDRFLTNLASDLSASDVPSDKIQSARVLMWWSEAKRNLSGATAAILTYVDEYRATYRGRGLPVEYDTTIGQRAMNIGMAVPFGSGGFEARTTGGGSSTTSGSQLSFPSQSASELAQSAAAAEQMKEVTSALRSMQSSISSLSSKVERMEGWKSDAHITCSKCSQVGHRAKNCPDKRKNKKAKEEDEEDEEK